MNMDNYASYIEVNPAIMMGKPVIKGTRITVELIIEKLAYGESIDSILEDYPSLNRETIYAALQFSAEHRRGERA